MLRFDDRSAKWANREVVAQCSSSVYGLAPPADRVLDSAHASHGVTVVERMVLIRHPGAYRHTRQSDAGGKRNGSSRRTADQVLTGAGAPRGRGTGPSIRWVATTPYGGARRGDPSGWFVIQLVSREPPLAVLSLMFADMICNLRAI